MGGERGGGWGGVGEGERRGLWGVGCEVCGVWCGGGVVVAGSGKAKPEQESILKSRN